MWVWGLIALFGTALSLACVALTFLELVFVHSVATAGAARHCFVAAFALSGTIFAILLYGLLGLVHPSTAEHLLSLLLTAAVLSVTVILPLITFRAFARQLFGNGRLSDALALSFVLGAWFIAGSVVSPCGPNDDASVVPEAADVAPCAGFFDVITARAAFVGACLVGVLGGFAIVSTPLAYLEPVLRWTALSAAERRMSDLKSRQQHVVRMWASKRTALAALSASHLGAAANNNNACGASGASGGFFSRLRSAFDGGSGLTEEGLAFECEGYSHVSSGLFLATQEASETLALAVTARSWKGAVFVAYGIIMSLYCVVKLLTTAGNLLLGRFSSVDPVPRAFTVIGLIAGETTYLTSQFANIALAFNTVMVISAVRGFLVLVFRLTCNNRAVTAETSLFAFSLVLSLYFLGLAVLMRLSLPTDFRSLLAQAVGALPYRYYHWWHDVVMLTASLSTLLVRRMLHDDGAAAE